MRRRNQDGSALFMALVAVMVLMGFSGLMVTSSTMNTMEVTSSRDQIRRLHLSKAGVRRAILDLASNGTGSMGNEQEGVPFGSGSFWTFTADNGDGTFTITSHGQVQDRSRTIEAVVREADGVFSHAIFAGNSSEDPTYEMKFGGQGTQADLINGAVYSGQNLLVEGNATINGTVRASGEIQGTAGQEGVTLPVLDIQAMNYETNHDVNVAAEFSAFEQYKWDNAGGSAWQLPKDKQSHIFRKNPSDRRTEYRSTVKNDYFLEDPYEAVNVDRSQNGSDPFKISLTGGGQPGPYGNRKLYFIDGNLWIHNKKSYSFQLLFDQPEGLQVTFVVKGNIYISDNLFYNDPTKDGLALIAITDSEVEDSGNIYFGDPVYGTLQKMNAFMYAENTFYDNNLDAEGSALVELNGIMSAGNHVDINRDYGDSHSRLQVNFDERVSTGVLNLPSLPGEGGSRLRYTVLSWREITANP